MEYPLKQSHYMEFKLGKKEFVMPVESVQRVVHAVEITRLPKAPPICLGLINYKGEILPVVDISRRFHLPERGIEVDRYFIIVRSKARKFALVTDDIGSVIEVSPENIVMPTEIIAGMEYLSGIMKLQYGMMLIPDLDKLLTDEEEVSLSEALQKKNKKSKQEK